MKMIEVKRDHQIISNLCKANTVIRATAVFKEISIKRGYQNVLLTNIEFEFMNNKIILDHCWLQQCDYPKMMKKAMSLAKENSIVTIEFKFYKYRDAVDRGMHGMTVSKILITPKKNK